MTDDIEIRPIAPSIIQQKGTTTKTHLDFYTIIQKWDMVRLMHSVMNNLG